MLSRNRLTYVLAGATLLALAASWIFGNALTVFLNVAVLAMIVYYAAYIRMEAAGERRVLAAAQGGREAQARAKATWAATRSTYRFTGAIVLLTALWAGSLFTVHLFLRPGGKRPYFLNTDHHAIQTKGVRASGPLVLCTSNTSPAAPGLYTTESGTLRAETRGGAPTLIGQDFFEPIFEDTTKGEPTGLPFLKKLRRFYTAVNLPWDVDVSSGATLRAGATSLRISSIAVEDTGGFFGEAWRTTVRGTFETSDPALLAEAGLAGSLKDTFLVRWPGRILTGITLRTLLAAPEDWSSGAVITRQTVEGWLTDGAPVMLLARYRNGALGYAIFPTARAIAAGCTLADASGAPVPLRRTFQHTTSPTARLYRGLDEAESAFTLSAEGASGVRMSFARPGFFSLRLAGRTGDARRGTAAVRNLANHWRAYLSSPLEEGFLFSEELRDARDATITAHLSYTADKPGVPLRPRLYDGAAGGAPRTIAAGEIFGVRSTSGLTWEYGIEDFSAGIMSYRRICWSLTAIFLAMAAVLLFARREKLDRIEPPLLFLLYALLVVRYLLLWRVATFPPADDASPSELEALRGADRWGPLPLTLTATLAFLGLLWGWRVWSARRKKTAEKSAAAAPAPATFTAENPRAETSPSARLRGIWENPFDRVVVQHILALIGCAVAFYLAGSIGFEPLRRVASIVAPVAIYLWSSWRLRALGEAPALLAPAVAPGRFARGVQRFLTRAYDSREAVLSLLTFGALFLLDRGFGVLFLLFLLLKNVVVSFARKPLVDYVPTGAVGLESERKRGSFWRALLRPESYWIYGVLGLLVYLLFLSYRGLFHALLDGRWWVIGAGWVLLIATIISVVKSAKTRRTVLIAAAIPTLLVLLFARKADAVLLDEIKHVRHRAALIHEPVEKSIAAQPYNSFDERRILETAESQWFINSYQDLRYDGRRRINLRPHFDRGVTYLTQTRDVLLPRFVIAEHGSLTMMWLLVLLAVPVLIYFLSYRIAARGDDSGALTPKGYPAALAVLLLATIGLFVWLTSTARFVFFGQDFPLLSASSKVALALPLVLLLAILTAEPERAAAGGAVVGRKGFGLGILVAVLLVVIGVTGRSNYQTEDTFTVRMDAARVAVDGGANSLLRTYQDSVQNAGGRIQLGAAMRWMREHPAFQQMLDTAQPYTASVLQRLVQRPLSATQPSSPVYLRYDGEDGRYTVAFNRNLYRELPVYESHAEWAGDVYEWGTGTGASVTLPNGVYAASRLPYAPGAGPVRVAVIPREWLADSKRPLALVAVENEKSGASATLRILPGGGAAGTTQTVRGWAEELPPGALAYAEWQGRAYPVRYSAAAGRPFAANHLINGHRRMLYPLAERCTWAAQYARAATAAWSLDTLVNRPAPVTLDYALTDSVARYLEATFGRGQKQPRNFRFAVVAADGDGRVRLMSDWAVNRQPLDPNNARAVAKLESDYYFRSNALLERDQWGNTNLVHFAKGPGSSIKPVIAAAVASQLAAEWSAMVLGMPGGEALGPSPKGLNEIRYYAGMKLSPAWREGHGGDFVGTDFQGYVSKSNNIYHSLFLFLGSYPREAFIRDGRRSIANVLDARAPAKGRVPTIVLGGRAYGLGQWGRGGGGWPQTDAEVPAAGAFGNTESLISRGLSLNFGVYTGDADKTDYSLGAATRAAFGDSVMLDTLRRRPVTGYGWSFPAASEFLQALRTSPDPAQNFNVGLRNPTLGGFPISTITPLKMAEMYGRLATQDRSFALHIAPRARAARMPFLVDEGWGADGYGAFVRDAVLAGMEGVLVSGTGAGQGWSGGARYSAAGQTFYCYAKTGTISEQSANTGAGNSRRFALLLSTEDLRGENRSAARIYTVFFTADKMQTAGAAMGHYRRILEMLTSSRTFREYMRAQPTESPRVNNTSTRSAPSSASR